MLSWDNTIRHSPGLMKPATWAESKVNPLRSLHFHWGGPGHSLGAWSWACQLCHCILALLWSLGGPRWCRCISYVTGIHAWLLCSFLFSSHCTESTARIVTLPLSPEWGVPCWVISTMPSFFFFFSAVGRNEIINFFSWPLWNDMACAWRHFSGRSPNTGVSSLSLLVLTKDGAGLMSTSPRPDEMKDSLPIMPSVHRLSV